MYAAFGHVAEAANRLLTQQWIRYGFLSDQQTVLGALYDLATNHLAWLVALIVGIYVLRRLVDLVFERTGLRILGLGRRSAGVRIQGALARATSRIEPYSSGTRMGFRPVASLRLRPAGGRHAGWPVWESSPAAS
jgi:hypothetical protein